MKIESLRDVNQKDFKELLEIIKAKHDKIQEMLLAEIDCQKPKFKIMYDAMSMVDDLYTRNYDLLKKLAQDGDKF